MPVTHLIPSSPLPLVAAACVATALALTPGVSATAGAPPAPVAPPAPATAAASSSLVDRATAAGITWSSTPSWDVTAVDYDLDGDLDFSMSLHMRHAGELRRNNGDGSFTQVGVTGDPATTVMPRPTEQNGLVDRHACTWADFDRNGLPDLYCAAGRYASNRVKYEGINNELFLQRTAGSFVERATASGVDEPCQRGRHPAALDVNGDGWIDLFVGAQRERRKSSDPCNARSDHPYIEQSHVFVNRGVNGAGTWLGFRFGREWDVSKNNAGLRAAAAWDYDHDSRTDLLAMAFANKRAYLFHNTGTGFVEVSRAGPVRLPLFNGLALADLTGDGIDDLVFADNAGFGFRPGTASGIGSVTTRIGTVASNARGWSVAIGDINGDGRLDVYGLTRSAGSGGNPDDLVFVRTASGGWQRHVVPSAGGDASDVAAVPVGGRAQFLVLNGGNGEKKSPGPVQLIAWVGAGS